MFIYPRENLIYTLAAALCIVISLFHLLLINMTLLIHTQQMRHDQYNLPKSIIHRSENFQPCIEQSDPVYPMGRMIICNEEATSQFSNRLPIIITQSDHSIINNNEYIITTIIIEDNPNIEICSTGTFANVMMMSPTPLTTTTAMHPGSRIERKLLLTGLSLHIFQHGCFKGLSELNILHIKNYQSTADSLKKLSGNLFQELKHLKNLKVLHLENIDLSIGIPQYAFYGWINQLKVITLINNNLNTIHNEAFPSIVGTDNNDDNNGLRELRIEKQNEDGWKLLENSNQWGRYLHRLRVFSLEGTSLRKTLSSSSSTNMRLNKYINMIKIDFGDYVNRHLEYLNVQNCELTHLVNTTTTPIIDNQFKSSDDLIGLNLNYLGGQLKQLYIGYNKFIDFNFLYHIKHFRNLRLLSINGNQLPVGTLPNWFNTQWPYLYELQIASNGITYIPTDTISSNLKVLHLSENPLELFDYNWIQQNDDRHGGGGDVDREIKLSELHLNSIRLISVQLEGSQANWERIFQPIKYSLEHLSLINCQLEANMFIKSSNNTATTTNNNTLNRNNIYLNLGLNNLIQLKSLILSGNYLDYIPPGLFQSLHQLDNLILTQNQLLTIHEPRMISERDGYDDKSANKNMNNNRMHRLLRLDLSHNNLITLERCAYALGFSRPFESILPLQPTWLAENGERQQPQQEEEQEQQHYEVSTEYTTLNQIYWRGGLNIIGNPFICDCRLAWFRQFIDQMSKTLLAQNEKQSFAFKNYLNEAINFTCYGANQLSGRYFLTLTPTDLYTIDHADCQSRPDIYGYDAESLDSLKPCWMLNRTFSPRLEQILETKQGMLMRSRFLTGSKLNPSVVLENATSVSNEALTLIIIAGVAALCFIIVSIIIIIWLCIRLKRKTPHRSTTTLWHKRFYRGRLNEVSCGGAFKRLHSPCCSLSMCDLLSCTNCNPKKCTKHCSLCGCSVYPKRTSLSTSETDNLMRTRLHRSEDNSVISTGILRNSANNNDRYYYDKVNRKDDGGIDSIYSDTNDLNTQETQSLNRYTGNNNNTYNSSRRRLLHDQRNRRYRQTKQSNNFASGDEAKFSLPIRHTSQFDNTANSNIVDSVNYRTSNKYTYEKPLYTSASVHTLLNVDHEHLIKPLHQPPSTDLLPPVPPPRKSKSIGDLLQNARVESTQHTPTTTTSPRATTPLNLRRSARQLAMRKVGEQSVVQQSTDVPVHLLRHYDTKRKHSPAYTSSIRRSVLPWRDKSADNNDNNGRPTFINNRQGIKNVFRRNRLVVSARPRLENTQEKNNVHLRNNWLSASRRRLRKTCEWLKRDRHSKTQSSSHSSTQDEQQSVLQPTRSKDDIRFLGPELPKPFFLLPKQQEAEYAIPVVDSKRTTHTDYLPMSPGNYSDHRPLEGRSTEATSSSPNKKSPIDEYVTDLIHIQNMNYPSLILSDTIKLPLQQQLPITTIKQTTSDIVDPVTMTTTPTISTTVTTTATIATIPAANTSPPTTTSNKPIRPPRHQKLQITGDLYSIQTFANSNNSLTTGLEVNKNKRTEKYLPLPPPPPPPPFMLNRTELLKVNNSDNTSTLIGSSKTSKNNNNNNTSAMNNANLSLFPLPPLLSPKPRNISIKPLRSAKLPRQLQPSAAATTTTTAVTTTQPKTSNFPTGQYNQSLRGSQRAQQPTYNIEDDNNNNNKGTDRV